MPHLTPALPLRYRRRALAALEGLVARARGDVARHLATVGRLAAAGERTTDARASLGFVENNLALLRGCLAARRPWRARSPAWPWAGRTDRTAGGSRDWRAPRLAPGARGRARRVNGRPGRAGDGRRRLG